MSTAKSRGPRLVLGLVFAALVVVGLLWRSGLLEADAPGAIAGAPVRRGPLEITVTERGNLEAQNSHSMKSEVEGRSTILFLVEEGTHVRAGDLVAELDASQLIDKRVGQEISLETARASSTKATENLKIQEIENESLVAGAEQEVVFATTDLEKFRQGDRPQQLEMARESILLAEEDKKRAEDTLDWSQQLNAKGFVERTELERDELAFKRAGILLEQSRREKTLLERYEHPKEEARLAANLEEAQRQLRKAKLQAVAQLADYQAEKKSASVRLTLEEEKLAKLEQQISKARITAPVDGMVVYGREEGNRYSGGEPVQEGGEVRERQEIATIPSAGGMIAKASIHESVLKQVSEGLPAIVRVDALPGREFRGSVGKVAVLPDKNSWWANPNLRLYRTDIKIDGGSAEMRPGMSCNIEILVEMIEDTLFVPLQSVHFSGGRNIAWVQQGRKVEERQVEVGSHNEKWVAIVSGLTEGEIVLLSSPPDFKAGEAAAEGAPRPGGREGADAKGGAGKSGRPKAGRPGAGTSAGNSGSGRSRQAGQ
jgi:HlyD family secretion protein